MPTYEYRCLDCGHTIEIIHSILEDGPEVCERCRGPIQRVLHPTGVIFRGSGFYVTDSRSSKAKATGESGAGEGRDSGEGKEHGEGKERGEGKGGEGKGGEGKAGSAKGHSSDGSGGGTSTPAADSGSGGKD